MDLLLDRLLAAARGRPPPPDGAIEVVPKAGAMSAIVAFTAHHVIAADVDEDQLRSRLPPDDLSAPTSASFLLYLAGWVGAEPGVIDLVLARTGGEPAVELIPRADLVDHPRVQRASRYRDDLSVWTDPSGAGVLILGRGLCGRWEMAFEIEPGARDQGLGRRLAMTAPTLVPAGEPLFAQVSPGNAASVRSVLAAGYTAIGSEVLFVG